MSNIWFTSDTHFAHNKEFIWKARGYENIDQMNEDIVKKWNSCVSPEDIVYHLGDVMLKDNEEGVRLLKELNGRIFIIAGNHDTDARIHEYKKLDNVISVKFADRMKKGKYTLFLSHFPCLVANLDDDKKIWNLSGHTHTTDKFSQKQNQIYNVGVDAHNCYPVLLDEILEDIRKLRHKEI